MLHKNSFLILENIRENIAERNDYLQTAFINVLKEEPDSTAAKTFAALQQQLNIYNIHAKILTCSDTGISKSNNKALLPEDNSTVYLSGIHNDSFFYQKKFYRQTCRRICVPAQDFMQPLLVSQKKEVFESYLLISKSAGLIYKDSALPIHPGIHEDTLIAAGTPSLFAGIKEINLRGIPYKMFYYPFKLGTQEMQLCGFVRADEYFSKLHEVPVTFIYPLVIALLLVIMLLPILKFYLMGKEEHIKYTDFIFGVLSLFTGAAVLTIIIIQVLLLWAADIRTEKNLGNLSHDIDSSFTHELTSAFLQLKTIDSIVKNNMDTTAGRQMGTHKNYNVSGIINRYFQQQQNKAGLYYNFNRISWIDKDGDQHLKGQIDDAAPVFTNVAARSYFQILQNNEGYAVPGYPQGRCGFEPVNSWTNGDFNVIISMKSLLGNGSIAAMSAQLHSAVQTILPPGYGFCIIDNNGKVMLHTDMSRNLKENFIEKTSPSRPLTEAIKSRQAAYFNRMHLYGNTTAMYIRPIASIPYHLVTFYDKGYIVPVNMRILTFSMVFYLISFASSMLLWLVVFRRKHLRNKTLYDPMFFLRWLIPKARAVPFYLLSIFFLLTYLVLQVIMLISSKSFEGNNYAILLLILLLPVNIFSGLFIINFRVKKDNYYSSQAAGKKFRHTKAWAVILVQPLSALLVYYYSASADYPVQYIFLVFESLFFIFLCAVLLLPPGTFRIIYKSSVDYVSMYGLFGTLLLVCVSVLPAGIYTWYAHNQEITQTVKKQQLYLAMSLKERALQKFLFAQKRQTLHPPAAYADWLQYRQGVYTIYNDRIIPDAINATVDTTKKCYEKFYFSVADDIGNNYYDPLLIPALKEKSFDNTWFWSATKDSLFFWYRLYVHPLSDSAKQQQEIVQKPLHIISAFPSRYVFAVYDFRGIILALMVAAFLLSLYFLVKFISRHLFLRKFIADADNNSNQSLADNYEEYKNAMKARGLGYAIFPKEDVDNMSKEYLLFTPADSSDSLYIQEKQMTDMLDKYWEFYLFTWNKCWPGEKYLMLGLAQYGFMNFKNTPVIYGLIKRGILIQFSQEIKFFSPGFRAFVLEQKGTAEMIKLQKDYQQGSAWQTMRMPLLFLLLGVAMFIFFTQEQTFQKITALVAGISTIFSLLLKFFSEGGGMFSSKK